MPEYTQEITINGAPVNLSATVTPAEQAIEGDPGNTKGVAWLVNNNGNVAAIINFTNFEVVSGGTQHGLPYAKVSNQNFASGSVLEPGQTLEIGGAVKLGAAAPGATAKAIVRCNIEDPVQA